MSNSNLNLEKSENENSESSRTENAILDALKSICTNNLIYFQSDESESGLRIHGAFVGLIDHIDFAKPLIAEIEQFAGEYDFDEATPGNGYRSFLYVFNSALNHTLKVSKYVTENRGSLLFRKNIYMK